MTPNSVTKAFLQPFRISQMTETPQVKPHLSEARHTVAVVNMNKLIQSIFALSFVAACGGSFPAPDQRLTDAEAAARSARELGAESDPGAALSLKLANEEISRAKAAMADDDNERANSLLVRAQADAELAIAQTREKAARLRRQRAIDSSATQRTTNRAEGASR